MESQGYCAQCHVSKRTVSHTELTDGHIWYICRCACRLCCRHGNVLQVQGLGESCLPCKPCRAVKCTTYTNQQQQQQQHGYMVMETRTFPLVSATATRGENSREQGSFVPRPTPFSPLFCFCLLLSTQTEDQKQGKPGNKARARLIELPGLPVWSMSTTFNAINDPRGCVAQLMDEGGSDSLWRRGGSMQNTFLLKDGSIWYTYHMNHRLWWRALYEHAWTSQIWSKWEKDH